MGFEIEKRLLQPWEKISFQVGLQDEGNLAQFLEGMAGLDLSETQDRIADFAKVNVAQSWLDKMKQDLEAAMEAYLAGVNDEDEWYQNIFGYVAEWALNSLIPGAGTVLAGYYEWDQDIDALENYERALEEINKRYEGTYLEEYANSALDTIEGAKEQFDLVHLTGTALGLAAPEILDYFGEAVSSAFEDTKIGDWYTTNVETHLGIESPGESAIDAGLTGEDFSDAVLDFDVTDADTYDAMYDINFDGIIDVQDVVGYENANMFTERVELDIIPDEFVEKISPFEIRYEQPGEGISPDMGEQMQYGSIWPKEWEDYQSDLDEVSSDIDEYTTNFFENYDLSLLDPPPSTFEKLTDSNAYETFIGDIKGNVSKPMQNWLNPAYNWFNENMGPAMGWLSPYAAQYAMRQDPYFSPAFSYANFDYWGNPYFTNIPGAYDAPAPSINPMLLRNLWEN